MKKTKIQALVALALITLFSQVAYSSQLRWLNYSPVRYFTDADWDIAKTAARNALNDGKDGVTVNWDNPESKNHGSLTPLSTNLKNGTTCRHLKIENHANGLSGMAVYEFCKKPDGKWGAVSK